MAFHPPPGVFNGLGSLRLIHGLGAGVNALLDAPGRPPKVPVARVVGKELTQGMAQHVVHAVVRETRDYRVYDAQQRAKLWQRRTQRHARDITVGIMGFGAIGEGVARALTPLGYCLRGWSRARRAINGVDSFAGEDEMEAFLRGTLVLVVLLPSTPETRGIINAHRLMMLPHGAILVAAGRGGQVDEAALLDALGSGQISHAYLDVFEEEPQPPGSPLWDHPGITMTPHIAGSPHPAAVAALIMENLARVEAGQPPLHAVNERKGY